MNERTDNRKDVKIGIIGKGFVGTAVAHGFSHQTSYVANIKIYDIDPVKSQHTLEDTVNNSDFLFLSVPTPSSKDGTMDLSIVENALQSMNDINQNKIHSCQQQPYNNIEYLVLNYLILPYGYVNFHNY